MNKDNINLCILCYENKATIYDMDCIHFIFCENCIIKDIEKIVNINKCPICQKEPLKIFIDDILHNKILNSINSKYKNIILEFGKYKGMTLRDIIKKDNIKGLNYLKWIKRKWEKQKKDLIELNKFINYVENNLNIHN